MKRKRLVNTVTIHRSFFGVRDRINNMRKTERGIKIHALLGEIEDLIHENKKLKGETAYDD